MNFESVTLVSNSGNVFKQIAWFLRMDSHQVLGTLDRSFNVQPLLLLFKQVVQTSINSQSSYSHVCIPTLLLQVLSPWFRLQNARILVTTIDPSLQQGIQRSCS